MTSLRFDKNWWLFCKWPAIELSSQFSGFWKNSLLLATKIN